MERVPVVSSNLAEIGYEGGILEVAFKNGSVYQYDGVPVEVHAGLMAAPSHGQYLDRFIKKGGYVYRRIS
ncbi:KTSC domain-containing protein [Nocardioides limicola]|uniref:KTSC domain-containing protein n=1 Tax=Nocardioides limicola TaxID=2803368 RepID=UPI00193BE7D2|nr:KTSC domain-containing protein [Nocardioides sp. DJM-14]